MITGQHPHRLGRIEFWNEVVNLPEAPIVVNRELGYKRGFELLVLTSLSRRDDRHVSRADGSHHQH